MKRADMFESHLDILESNRRGTYAIFVIRFEKGTENEEANDGTLPLPVFFIFEWHIKLLSTIAFNLPFRPN